MPQVRVLSPRPSKYLEFAGVAQLCRDVQPTSLAMLSLFAGVAQLVEQLICNQQVGGSSPSTSSIFYNFIWASSRVAKGGRL